MRFKQRKNPLNTFVPLDLSMKKIFKNNLKKF